MQITRENLIRIAKETAEKSALSDPNLVAAYLTGSLRTNNPFLGDATDVDIVFIHAVEPKVRREIIPISPETHLDIIHNPRRLYEKPKELRVHPWLGPELYDPLPLYVTRHFFEFVQAGVRDRFNEPANVQARSQQLVQEARQLWNKLKSREGFGPAQELEYLRCASLAANAVALLAGNPLGERRFLLQFAERARAANQPDLAARLLKMLGANAVDKAALSGFLPEWERNFLDAAASPSADKRISAARLGYYKLAFQAMLAGELPQAVLWPLLLTWTLAAAALPPLWQTPWRSACEKLGLSEASFHDRLGELDKFLDSIEALQARPTTSQA